MNELKSTIEKFSNLDKKLYNMVRFGDFSFNISERVEPSNTDAKIYVGLEHLDSGSIYIRRKGKPSDVKGTKLKVYKGDIIFGKRRAYQKKAAIADFEGICSAHAMVLRANPEKIDPRFFPFLLHSDAFMNRAVEISEGSLSPTIKWKILAEQKFKLPPMEIQKRLADLFWTIDVAIEHYINTKKQFLIFRKSFYSSKFSNPKKVNKLKSLPIDTINGLWKSDDDDSIQIKIIRSTEFSEFGEINLTKLSPLSVSRKSFAKSKLLRHDIILERSGGGPDQPVGRVCFFNLDDEDFSFSNFTSVIRVSDKKIISPKYLFYCLLHFYELGGTDRIQKQTTGIRNLDYDLYLNIDIPLPTISEQNDIVKKIDIIESKRKEISVIIEKTVSMQKKLINSIF